MLMSGGYQQSNAEVIARSIENLYMRYDLGSQIYLNKILGANSQVEGNLRVLWNWRISSMYPAIDCPIKKIDERVVNVEAFLLYALG